MAADHGTVHATATRARNRSPGPVPASNVSDFYRTIQVNNRAPLLVLALKHDHTNLKVSSCPKAKYKHTNFRTNQYWRGHRGRVNPCASVSIA
jgi:hypothetical protein